VAVLSRYYNENNDPDSAIRIVMDEIEYLNTDAPYFSFRLLSARYQSYLDLGRKAEIIKLLNEHRQTFEDVAAERQKNVPADVEAAKEYERTTKSYESLAKAMQSGLARIKITNAEHRSRGPEGAARPGCDDRLLGHLVRALYRDIPRTA